MEDNPVSSSTFSDAREALADGLPSPVDLGARSTLSTPQTSPDGSTPSDLTPDSEKRKDNENPLPKKVSKSPVPKRSPAGPIQGGTVSTSNGLCRSTGQTDATSTSNMVTRPSSQVFVHTFFVIMRSFVLKPLTLIFHFSISVPVTSYHCQHQ